VDATNRSMTLLTSSPAEGRYVPVSRTNAMYVSPDGSTLVFAIPDGITAYTSALVKANLVEMGMSPVTEKFVVMPSVTARPYATENHLPVLSPNGSLLAVVRNDPNNLATLVVIDLANPGVPPIEIALNDRGEIVSELLFTPDSSILYYVQGGEANRALYALDMLSGSESRVSRGRLAQGVLSPEGTKIALIRRELGGERQTPYITLIAQDIATGNETVLFTGGEIVDNKVVNQRFAYLLAWRRSV
jgi:Tol biopolymer transport system component